MKIVHIITRLYKGGAEENTLMSCLHQARAGNDVTLMFGPDNSTPEMYASFQGEVQFQPLSFLRHPIRPFHDVRGLIEMMALFRKLRPDVVHTHESKAGVLGRLAARLSGVPCVVHGVHIIPFNNVPWAQRFFYSTMEHASALLTDLFIHVSAGTRQAYAREKIGGRKPHCVVHSGMDIRKFIEAQAPENWREILMVSQEAPKPQVIVMLAVFEPRKQHLGFLDGFAQVTVPGQNIRLVLAGDGPLNAEVEAKIAALNLGDRVVRLGHSSVPDQLIALADVGVLASVREGLPRVVVQYLAGKCPAVVSAIDGIEEIVKDGVNGIVVPSLSASDVAREAVALLADPTRLARLKDGAAATDVSAWSFETMFKGLDRAYALLGTKGGEAAA